MLEARRASWDPRAGGRATFLESRGVLVRRGQHDRLGRQEASVSIGVRGRSDSASQPRP